MKNKYAIEDLIEFLNKPSTHNPYVIKYKKFKNIVKCKSGKDLDRYIKVYNKLNT